MFSGILRPPLFILLFLSLTSSDDGYRNYKDGDVIVGGLFNIHYSGTDDQCTEISTTGLGYAEATIFAIEKINKNSSILPNVTIGYDLRDYCWSKARAMKIAYDFMCDGDPAHMSNQNISTSPTRYVKETKTKTISALVGPTESGSAVLVGSLLHVSDIPVISPSVTSDELSSQMYKNFFRTVPPDNWRAKVMADIIELFNWTYVAAVGLDDSYGHNGISALEKESFNRKTFCIAFSEYIPRLGYWNKTKQTVFKIKRRSEVSVIIVWLSGAYGRAFFAEATTQNLEGKTWILSDALTARGNYLDSHPTILNGSSGIKPHDYSVLEFEEHLKMITPAKSIERGAHWWEEFWRLHFNCSATNSNEQSGVALCEANLTLHHALQKIRGSFVSYTIDAVYAIAHALDNIYRCSRTIHGAGKRGKCPPVKPAVKGRDLEKYLRNISFDGLTGKVRFDKFGDPLTASYDIINFQLDSTTGRTLKYIRVGSWNKNNTPKLKIDLSRLRWRTLYTPLSFCSSECLPGTRREFNSPCCWDCIKCPKGTVSTENGSTNCTKCDLETKSNEEQNKCEKLPIINITHTTPSGIAITLMALIGVILTLSVCGIYIKLYNSPIVKASNREISFLLLFGISSLHILAVLELSEPSHPLCTAASFWRYFALNLCITVLFLKTMRMTSVFEVDKVAQLFAPCYKTLTRQSVFLSVMNLASVCLLVPWMFLDSPKRKKIIRFDEYVFLVCKPFETNAGLAFFISVYAYTLIVAFLCTYYAFKARGIPENFNETRYIGFSMYILLLSSLAYYPVAFAFESWYVAIVSCTTTLVTSFGLLGCMFGPRIYILFFQSQQNTIQSIRSQVMDFSFSNVTATRALPRQINEEVPNAVLDTEN
ncbi:extracellular calcium-sensing receptor-like [Porites lutea]|uniref:extracellular calcium-sensing receptor-like n=1 Tax=Porites lutea TaxID=51062 RepID=UPI003CC51DFE